MKLYHALPPLPAMPLTRRFVATSFTSLAVLTAQALLPTVSYAAAPLCAGDDIAGASRARNEGLKHYRASKHAGAADAELAAAVQSFDEACHAGDRTALEPRAYALAGLERYVDAAESLDAFLATAPLGSLQPEVRDRVLASQKEILLHVATLTVESNPAGLEVALDHFAAGRTPLRELRLTPGTHEVEVTRSAGTTLVRQLELVPGARSEMFDFAPPATDTGPVAVAPVVEPARAPRPSHRGIVYATGIGAAVGIGVGIFGLAYASGRANAYNAFRGAPDASGNTPFCASSPSPAGCSTFKTDYGVGVGLGVFGFVAAAGLGATAATFLYLDAAGSHSNEGPRPAPAIDGLQLRCGPMMRGAGASCSGVF